MHQQTVFIDAFCLHSLRIRRFTTSIVLAIYWYWSRCPRAFFIHATSTYFKKKFNESTHLVTAYSSYK
jgi:hypothetical protein